jgi:hypothetical protein
VNWNRIFGPLRKTPDWKENLSIEKAMMGTKLEKS